MSPGFFCVALASCQGIDDENTGIVSVPPTISANQARLPAVQIPIVRSAAGYHNNVPAPWSRRLRAGLFAKTGEGSLKWPKRKRNPKRALAACPLDCPDGCSLDVTIRDGRVEALDGNHVNPLTAGFICGKVRHFPEHMYGADRVMFPLVRSGPKGSGAFRRVSWDDALELVAVRLAAVRDQHGGEAILPYCYGGSNGWLSQDALDARFFYRLGASRLARTLCAMPTSTALSGLYGKIPGVAYEDYPQARLIVLWGVNPAVTGIHLAPFIRQAQANGAKLVVVDPRRTPLARQADLHLAVRPGTDLVVALAVIRWLFEAGRADLDFLQKHARNWEKLRERSAPWTFERAAEVGRHRRRRHRSVRPTLRRCEPGGDSLRLGAGAQSQWWIGGGRRFGAAGRGGQVRRRRRRVHHEPVGRLGRQRGRRRRGDSAKDPRRQHEPVGPDAGSATINPRSRPCSCTTAIRWPRRRSKTKFAQGLEREDLFTVVHEQVLTDTARYADVVLPATTFLEHTELRRSYGALLAQLAPEVVPPVGEARSNHWLFGELCRRLGLDQAGDPHTPEQVVQAIVGTSASGKQIAESLATTGRATAPCGSRPVQFVDVFPALSRAQGGPAAGGIGPRRTRRVVCLSAARAAR